MIRKSWLCLLSWPLWGVPEIAFSAEKIPIDSGSTAWMLMSTGLVLFMIPGLAMFYGGLVRTKNVLGTMMHSFIAMAIIGVLWAVCGYSLAFGKNILGGWIGWNEELLLFKGNRRYHPQRRGPGICGGHVSGKIRHHHPGPDRRGLCRTGSFLELYAFLSPCGFCWFIALCAIGSGLKTDFYFNGGAGVDRSGRRDGHPCFGRGQRPGGRFISRVPRHGYPKTAIHPNNLVMTLIGAGLLWVGWFGFNAGSTVSSGLDTARALTMTQLSAASGSLTWVLIEGDPFKKDHLPGFCHRHIGRSGGHHPGGRGGSAVRGHYPGRLSSLVCYCAILLKYKLGYDDTLDVFGVHGVGSGLGVFCFPFLSAPVGWLRPPKRPVDPGRSGINWASRPSDWR